MVLFSFLNLLEGFRADYDICPPRDLFEEGVKELLPLLAFEPYAGRHLVDQL